MGVPPTDPAQARQAALAVVRALAQAGHAAYFAGGCVRDELLGLAPADYDIATDAIPERLAAIFRHTRHVGAHFGVIQVHQDGCVIEVATFRADAPYSDKRRPDSVRFSNASDDAARRDFTVNALFLDPLDLAAPPQSPRGGRVIDLMGGMKDLESRVLRAVGDPEQRLAEDHLRALRAVRLAAKLDFTIDPATASAIRVHARDLAGVSRERVGDELRRMFTHRARARAASLLADLSLDTVVLAEPGPSRPAVAILASLEPDAPFTPALAAWALDRGFDPVQEPLGDLVSRWRSSLCLSNDESEGLRHLLRNVGTIRARWEGLPVAGRKRAAADAWFDSALALVHASDRMLGTRVRADVERLRATPSGLAPEPWVSGDDLIALGIKPGPRFKGVLDGVYDAQLEGRVATRAEALELARRWCV